AAFGVLGLLSMMGAYLIVGMAWERSSLRGIPSAISGWTLIRRALALRCPRCGRGPIFDSRFRMNPNCSVCGAVFRKSAGEWLGPVVVDYMVATASALIAWALSGLLGASAILTGVSAGFAALVITVSLSRWSQSFWTLLLYISGDISEPGANLPDNRL